MPGPAPKHASARRRTNKIPGAAKIQRLQPVSGKVKFPPLPKTRRDGDEWHPDTIKRWKAVHTSPMASEYDESDFFGLLDLAHLWDRAHKADSDNLALKMQAEIRMSEQRFGLSPLDRRRLSWEIERGEAAEVKTRQRRNQQAVKSAESKPDEPDPRQILAG